MNVLNRNINNIFLIFALSHLKYRPKWEGFTNNEIFNNFSEFICVNDICLGRYLE